MDGMASNSAMADSTGRFEIDGCETIPKLFWHQVKARDQRTAFREKDLGIWRATSWRDYGERARATGMGLLKLGLERAQGALVESVYPDTPASAAGLKANDVVLKVDGVQIRNENHLINLIAALPVGQRVKLNVWRDQRSQQVEAVVGDWNQAQARLKVDK